MYKSLRQQTLHYLARPHEGIRREPVPGEVAWRGDELRLRDDWSFALTDADINELREAVVAAQATGKSLDRLKREDFPLQNLAAHISDWRVQLQSGRGFVLIRNVPVQTWTAEETEIFYWCFGLHLGVPGAQNSANDLLGHVRDQRSGEDVRYYRTNKALDVHCDAADVVGLLCLQAAKSGGLSRLVSSVTVYNILLGKHPDYIERLYRPYHFDTKGEGGIAAFPISPCAYAEGRLRTFWESDYFRSAQDIAGVPMLSAKDLAVLDAYDAIANDPDLYLDMELQPGDLQLVSNHSILHARTAFEDWPEPERRRHLLRLWISLPEQRSWRARYLTMLSLAKLSIVAAKSLLQTQIKQRYAN